MVRPRRYQALSSLGSGFSREIGSFCKVLRIRSSTNLTVYLAGSESRIPVGFEISIDCDCGDSSPRPLVNLNLTGLDRSSSLPVVELELDTILNSRIPGPFADQPRHVPRRLNSP